MVAVMKDSVVVAQSPEACEFMPSSTWPNDLSQLFNESARTFAAGAYTASAMTSRKILMACAVAEGDTDGKSFAQYVDYITNKVLSFPRAKSSIDAIRTIGNDGNHKIAFVNKQDAHRALSIVKYMLDALYALPNA